MEFTLFYGFCPVSDVLDSAQVLTQKLLSWLQSCRHPELSDRTEIFISEMPIYIFLIKWNCVSFLTNTTLQDLLVTLLFLTRNSNWLPFASTWLD
jgi:hypothetical protein